jgi:hypothetical protein
MGERVNPRSIPSRSFLTLGVSAVSVRGSICSGEEHSMKADGNSDIGEGGVDLFEWGLEEAKQLGPLRGGLTSKEVEVRRASSQGEVVCAVSRVVTGWRGSLDEGLRTLCILSNSLNWTGGCDGSLTPSLVRVATAGLGTGLGGWKSWVVTVSFLGDSDRETDLDVGLTLWESDSRMSKSREIAHAANALVGASKRDFNESRWDIGTAKGLRPLAQ